MLRAAITELFIPSTIIEAALAAWIAFLIPVAAAVFIGG
jgi:hypothetical protein